MQLRKLTIENFRGIVRLDLDLDKATVLIGENNTGKTSILEALNLCMSRGLGRRALLFSEYDYHLASPTAEPAASPPIAVTLDFQESTKGEWPDEVIQAMDGIIQVLTDDRQSVILKITSSFDATVRDFVVDWVFLDVAGNTLPAKQQRLVNDLQQLAPVFLLTAVRDAAQHFQPRSAFWGPFTRNPDIPEDKRKEIEEQVGQVNQAVLDSHKPFEVVKDRLAQTGDLVPLSLADNVSVEAVPARILDMLARTQVKLASKTGAKLPIAQHGSGTQSLSVLFLFQAFLQSRLAEAYDKNSEPILALEEPESHLHPSAIKALWRTLESFPGQRLIATHSGDLLSAVPLEAIRRLARRAGGVEVFSLKPGTLDPEERLRVAYHVRSKRGALLFARCWLLVEGESDFTMMPEFAQVLQLDFEREGVACVEFAQCGLAPLIKTATDLGIEWHVLADGDAAGGHYVGTAKTYVGTDLEADRITQLTDQDIEHCLWNNGYQSIYENAVDTNHKSMVTAKAGTADYPSETITAATKSTSKRYLAYEVALEAGKQNSRGVPAKIRLAIEASVKMAQRSA